MADTEVINFSAISDVAGDELVYGVDDPDGTPADVKISINSIIDAGFGVYNVVKYGATGDGATDDTTAITNAQQAADTAGGGTVYFPEGIYNIPSDVEFDTINNVSWLGDGDGSIIRTTTDAYTNARIAFEDCDSLTFRNLKFDGQWDNSTTGITGKFLYISKNSTSLTVNGCSFYNIGGTALIHRTQSIHSAEYGDSTTTAHGKTIITNCRFYRCEGVFNTKGGGIRGGIFSSNHIEDCREAGPKIDAETFSGFYSDRGGAWIIANNVFHDNHDEAACIQIEEWVEAIIVVNNVFSETTDLSAIKIAAGQNSKDCDSILIANNMFYTLDSSGGNGRVIYITISESSAINLSDIVVRGNTFRNIDLTGVFVEGTNAAHVIKNITIHDNKFYDWSVGSGSTYDEAIILRGTADIDGVSICNNEFIRENGTYQNEQAIEIKSNVIGDVRICGNYFKGLTETEELVFCDSNTVYFNNNVVDSASFDFHGCTLYASGNQGSMRFELRISGATETTATLTNNIFTSATMEAIKVYNGTTLKAHSNVFLGDEIVESSFTGSLVATNQGTTGNRPSDPVLGQPYFDTTLGYAIWHDGTNWVDATGSTV